MLIIAGLGNPGDKYKDTYHNMGFLTVDKLADKLSVKVKRLECSSLTATLSKNGEKIVLAKPATFMNLSGQAVKSLLSKHKATADDLIVIYDDIDLPRFSIRARKEGSAGTHNGMRDIVNILGGGSFKRIRIGVGREDGELKDYVLSRIRSEDKRAFDECFERVADALLSYIENGDFDLLMRKLNVKEIGESNT